jgi:hypothetical protein
MRVTDLFDQAKPPPKSTPTPKSSQETQNKDSSPKTFDTKCSNCGEVLRFRNRTTQQTTTCSCGLVISTTTGRPTTSIEDVTVRKSHTPPHEAQVIHSAFRSRLTKLSSGIPFDAGTNPDFSLAKEMSKAGFASVFDLFMAGVDAVENPEATVQAATRLAKIRGENVFRTCLARLLFATSIGHSHCPTEAVLEWESLAEIMMRRSGHKWNPNESTKLAVSVAVHSSIAIAKGVNGHEMTVNLIKFQEAWEEHQRGQNYYGDDPFSARILVSCVAMYALACVLQDEVVAPEVLASLAGTRAIRIPVIDNRSKSCGVLVVHGPQKTE